MQSRTDMTEWDILASKILECKIDGKALQYFSSSGSHIVKLSFKDTTYAGFDVICDHCTTNTATTQRDTIRFQVCSPAASRLDGGISIYIKRVTTNHSVKEALYALAMAVMMLNNPANKQKSIIERDIQV